MTGKKRTRRNARQKRGVGQWHSVSGNVSPTAEPVCCDYCHARYWRTDPRQRYHDPGRERKLAHLRRTALVELLVVTLRPYCRLTLDMARRMVEAAEAALLSAVRRLGWVWLEDRKQFAWEA